MTESTALKNLLKQALITTLKASCFSEAYLDDLVVAVRATVQLEEIAAELAELHGE